MNNIVIFCIIIITVLVILQICQFETYESFYNDQPRCPTMDEVLQVEKENRWTTFDDTTCSASCGSTNEERQIYGNGAAPWCWKKLTDNQINNAIQNYPVTPTTTATPTLSPEEIEMQNAKEELIQKINDKLTVVNDKMNKFDNIKPIKSSAYRHLFETDVPNYINKVRGAKNTSRSIYDISQKTQDAQINNMNKDFNRIYSALEKDLGSKDTKINSIISHRDGKNLNLHQTGDYHMIPVNKGCLFVINNESGEVEYDVSNYSRTDKNKLCKTDNPEQHFKLLKVDKLNDYSEIIGAPLSNGPLTDVDNLEYPFYMLKPKNNELCLQSESEGIALQPCNYGKAQRWKGLETKKACSQV